MLRKAMLTLILLPLLAVLAAPAAWGEEKWAPFKTRPEAEQLLIVAHVMDGIWAANQFTARYWPYGNGAYGDAFKDCTPRPSELRESEIMTKYSESFDYNPVKDVVFQAYYEVCKHIRFQGGEVGTTSLATYKAWSEPERIVYLEWVGAGIQKAFNVTGRRWPAKQKAALLDCKATPPAVSAALAKMDDGKSGKRSAAKLVFAAYETACRERKGK